VLSWLALRGRCRTCDVRISARYPVVEFLSCVLWLAAGLRFGMTYQTGAAIALFYLLMILAFIDFDTMRLPNSLVGLLAVIGLLGAALSQFLRVPVVPLLPGLAPLGSAPLAAAAFGALVCAVPALVLSLVMSAILKRPALGMGDVKLLGVIGIFLGAYGLLAFFVGSVVGSVYAVATRRRRAEATPETDGAPVTDEAESAPDTLEAAPQPTASTPFPFGPALVIGVVVVTLVGPQMWTWYQSLFGL